jgi:DNA-directed RNA polymerase subunit E'/Rpb7
MDYLFVQSIIRDVLLLKPHQLGSNFRAVIQATLRRANEGLCSRHGWILPGSVALRRVGDGHVEASTLNGDVRFAVQYSAEVCNPPVGAVVPARVVGSNKFGLLAHSGVTRPDGTFLPVLEIIITKMPSGEADSRLHSLVALDGLGPGAEIWVEVLGRKFELNDDRISVIGRAVEPPLAAARPLARRARSRTAAAAAPSVVATLHAAAPRAYRVADDDEAGEETADKAGHEDKADDDEDDDDDAGDEDEDADDAPLGGEDTEDDEDEQEEQDDDDAEEEEEGGEEEDEEDEEEDEDDDGGDGDDGGDDDATEVDSRRGGDDDADDDAADDEDEDGDEDGGDDEDVDDDGVGSGRRNRDD